MNDYNEFCSTVTGFPNDHGGKPRTTKPGKRLNQEMAWWSAGGWIGVPPVHVLSTFPGGRSTFPGGRSTFPGGRSTSPHVRSMCCPRSILVMSQAPIPGNMQRLYWKSLSDHTRKMSLHVLANPGMSSLRTTMPGNVHGIIPEHSFDQLFLVVLEYDLKWPSFQHLV